MKRKIATSVFIIIVTVALLTGASYAWFTHEVGPIDNEFTAGTVEIEADETVSHEGFNMDNWNPGDEAEKEFTIINKGTKAIALRGIFTAQWYEKVGNDWVEWTPDGDDAVKITYEAGDNWEQKVGDPNTWYYKSDILGTFTGKDEEERPVDQRKALFKVKVKLDGPTANNQYQGKRFVLSARFQAIQASHAGEWDWDDFDNYN